MSGAYGDSNRVQDIRAILATLLADELGVVQSKANRSTRPAIYIEPPNAPITGTGLHCVIQQQPRQFNGDLYYWDVTLIARDRDEASLIKLNRALQKMRNRFPNRREISVPYDEDQPPEYKFSLMFHYDSYPYSYAHS